ncbi:metallophosphoesterase [Halovivax gelatinilyticus]|uniref:metallophosphoesterase n=1 Tax=Halovivax gelatinilyticus TaxID=2961597 RepID=UPI0020CA71BB|nr:metallophosphoesterase [Halovivax gelatinilyticus]
MDRPRPPLSFDERAVYLPAAETLVIADVHLGRGEVSAVDAPIDAAERVVDRLDVLIGRFSPQTVVVAGDLLHSFTWVSRGVREAVDRLVATVDDAHLVCTPGNHDTMVESVFDGETPSAYRLADGETVVCHGHEQPPSDEIESQDGPPALYVIGHDHPALSIDGRKHPCFLFGPGAYEHGDGPTADVLVLPAFSRLARGTKINARRANDFQSPLVTDVDGLYPIVRDETGDETLWFPPLGESRRLL